MAHRFETGRAPRPREAARRAEWGALQNNALWTSPAQVAGVKAPQAK